MIGLGSDKKNVTYLSTKKQSKNFQKEKIPLGAFDASTLYNNSRAQMYNHNYCTQYKGTTVKKELNYCNRSVVR